MDHVRRVVIGLGSNVGDRAAQMTAAVERLRSVAGIHVLRRSPCYETAPEGGLPQGDYLNGAVLVVTALAARDILDRTLEIERALGRDRAAGERNAPRTIDLDVLWIEGEHVDEPGLGVPHPRLRERSFALRPLLDVAPDASDPRTHEKLASLPAAQTDLKRVD